MYTYPVLYLYRGKTKDNAEHPGGSPDRDEGAGSAGKIQPQCTDRTPLREVLEEDREEETPDDSQHLVNWLQFFFSRFCECSDFRPEEPVVKRSFFGSN